MPQAAKTAKQNWRLKKTLGRHIRFRPMEREDMRYLWAAYKKGSLSRMGPPFNDETMTADAFREAFETNLIGKFHGAWTLFAEVPNRGEMPVGAVLGFWPHPDAERMPFMIVGEMVWFPWATPRNCVETAVHFFNVIRRDIPMVEYAASEDKRFFEMIAKHGVMRRVGTSYNVYAGEPAAVFETRRLNS